MAVEGVGERREFPSAEMGSQEKNAFAPGEGAIEILKTVVNDDVADIVAGVAREKANLGELATEGREDPTQDFFSLTVRHIGEGEGEVAESDAAKLGVEQVDQLADGDAEGMGDRARKQADSFNDAPDQRVLEAKSHREGRLRVAAGEGRGQWGDGMQRSRRSLAIEKLALHCVQDDKLGLKVELGLGSDLEWTSAGVISGASL